MSVLRKNQEVYLGLLNIFRYTKSNSLKLELAKLIGQLAYKFHPGNFRDSEIESFFESYSQNLSDLELQSSENMDQKNIVHVFTTVYETGGHIRFVESLIDIDKQHRHHVYVTNQAETQVSSTLRDLIKTQNGYFIIDRNDDDLLRSRALCEFVSQYPGKIFLHIHPYDVVPSIAFNKYKDSRDIYFVNHADHAFSFGLDVSSFLINIREEAQNIAINKRGFGQCGVLPLPIRRVAVDSETRSSLRKEYGITNDEILGVCIGSGHKFKSNASHDFFSTIFKILLANSNLKITIIGLDEDLAKKHGVKLVEHPRLLLEGVVENPAKFQAMADIAVDPMPLGSYTALLETASYGAYPVICYNTNPLFDLSKDIALRDIITTTQTEDEYIERFNFLCANRQFLLEQRESIADNIQTWHSGEKWLEQYYQILSKEVPENNLNGRAINWAPYDEELAELNPNLSEQQRLVLSFFYSHSEEFSISEILRIVYTLSLLKFRRRDLLAILKKNMLHLLGTRQVC